MTASSVSCGRTRELHIEQITDRTRTEEVRIMSITDPGSGRSSSVKTLAIRLEPVDHTQLSLIAQLRGTTITDEIRTAIEAHIEAAKTTPELAAQADSVLADIAREAAARRQAIATLFGDEKPVGESADGPATAPPRRSKKPAGSEEVQDS
jgi:predicted DNA-binding protein